MTFLPKYVPDQDLVTFFFVDQEQNLKTTEPHVKVVNSFSLLSLFLSWKNFNPFKSDDISISLLLTESSDGSIVPMQTFLQIYA